MLPRFLAVLLIAGPFALAADLMPAAQQNQIIEKYCTICHTDASRNGGLSLQHFDAARVSPADAAMVLSKVRNTALGAAGIPVPDRPTQNALIAALTAESAGANAWVVERPSSAPVVIASIVEGVPSTRKSSDPDVYRLTLTCHADTHKSEMQLAWSPDVPKSGRAVSLAADRHAPSTWKAQGSETMGNGQAGTSGPGATTLYPDLVGRLPKQSLTVSNLFDNETISFPFNALQKKDRRALAACFSKR